MSVQVAISKAEDWSHFFVRKTRKVLPVIGRLLLISTFFEDGIRLLFNTADHAQHFASLWSFNYQFLYSVTLLTGISLLVGSLLVMLRIKMSYSCGLLAFVIVLQVLMYQLYTTYHLFTRNLSVLSGLLLLYTENLMQKPKKFDQLPRDGGDFEMSSFVLFACRMFLNLMLVSMMHFDLSYKRLSLCLISYAMMISLWCGFKTRLMSLLLATWLLAYNMAANDFWNRPDHENHIIRYDFFQALSTIGGLLLMIETGPGELSVDEYKKKW